GAPKMNERARAVLEPLIRDWVQILPLECLNTGPHWLINCLAYLPGVANLKRSDTMQFSSGRLALRGSREGLVLNPPLDGAPWPPIFKVEPFDTDVYVSGEFKRRYDEAGLTGLDLKPIRIVER
ncbi:MAG: hypothetical protein SFZ24_12005, partial [Planctomycetota bacterium]|nr:hypothetical protein [Planctomycetota bacterium]